MDYKRIIFFSFAIISGIAAAIFGQPFIHGNERAINIIVTAFSILAGFLVAIMTIIGDPGLFAARSWRYAEAARKNLKNRLTRQKWMFILYLVTLSLIFIASLIEKTSPNANLWLERIYLGTAISALILSFGLPSSLMNIQLSRHDEMIDVKRKAAGIK